MSASTCTRSSRGSSLKGQTPDHKGDNHSMSLTSPLRSSGDENCSGGNDAETVTVESTYEARALGTNSHMQKSGATRVSESHNEITPKKKVAPKCSLVVALFFDGFVCRHLNKQHECIEGFAQPYDAESSYFLACIDSGRVPDGLTEMIACTCSNGSVLTEIRDYREVQTAMCPVSSSFLPAASALLPRSEASGDPTCRCRAWQVLLRPSGSPASTQLEAEPPVDQTLPAQEIFDHFPDVEAAELETLAVDAKRQLLEDEVLLSSPSSQSSPCVNESLSSGFFPSDPPEHAEGASDDAVGLAKTPTTSAPATASLSPSDRKTTRPSSAVTSDLDSSSTKRRKRQLSKKVRVSHGVRTRASKRAKRATVDLEGERGVETPGHSHSEHPKDGRQRLEVKEEAELSPSEQVTPLPATQFFLSRLKGRRRRPAESELGYGKPAWMTIAHVGRLFRAATHFEQEHARFLHVNVQRFMQAEMSALEPTEEVAGSMRNLVHQLSDVARPTDVIAAATVRKKKAKESRCGHNSRDVSSPRAGSNSSEAAWKRVAVSTAMINPSLDPVLHHHRVEDQSGVFTAAPHLLAPLSYEEDKATLADTPPFNTFDSDGKLEEIQNI